MNAPVTVTAMPGNNQAPLPETAARGDDDLMSQPQPAGDSAWKGRIGAAKRTWSKLAGADLARVDGDVARLAELLRRNYAYNDAEIDRQIAGFLASTA
jgi:hypothetical protein